MIIYGIKNCDTMQKAFKFLDKRKIKYRFHDYKTEGIDKVTIENWLPLIPMEKIINLKSTTYRSLTEAEKASIKNKSKAINLILKNPSIIKRPILDLENGELLVGFTEDEWNVISRR